MSKEIYERAVTAKAAIARSSEDGHWDSVPPDDLRELHARVEELSYDERCVIAAGSFLVWSGHWQFQIPSTSNVIAQMKRRDSDGDDTFAAVRTHFTQKFPALDGRYCKQVRDIAIYSGKEKERKEESS